MLKKITTLSTVAIFFLSIFPVSAYLPADPLFDQQEYLEFINIREVWDISRGDDTIVAVLDSGVDISHPDLEFNIWKNSNEIPNDGIDNDNNGYIDDANGWDFVDDDNNPSPELGDDYTDQAVSHGTAVAGVIAAVSNNIGIIGVAFESKIMPLRVLSGDGEGSVDNLIRAIDYAVANGADVINLSLIGDERSQSLEEAIERANNSGVIVVSAAGNINSEDGEQSLDIKPAYPVCYGDSVNNIVIGVSSIGSDDEKSTFSRYGKTCIDLSALGERLISLSFYDPDNGFDNLYSSNWNGTSFSTAIVSGALALIKSKNPSLSASQISTILIDSTDDISQSNLQYGEGLGSGKLNILSALNFNQVDLIGSLIKLENSNAIYYLNNNKRYLFSNENVFWSWYSGSWSDHKITIVSQEEFDSYSFGSNITIRPGTKLIKFQNSGRIYAVSFNETLHYIPDNIAKKLYGDGYQNKVVLMQNSFESNYKRGAELNGSTYPSGSIISYKNSNDIWLIQGSEKRKFEKESFVDNGFKTSDIINNVSSSYYFKTGRAINEMERAIYKYIK